MPRKRRILEIESIIGCFGGEKSRAQFRALLAVARAAQNTIKPYLDAKGRNIGGGHAGTCKCGLCFALRRLERVSGGKP